jgi:hypothetical protein
MADPSENIENHILSALASSVSPLDSDSLASELGVDAQAVIGCVKSLQADEYVAVKQEERSKWVLSEEAEGYIANGSPEAQLFAAIPADGGIEEALTASFAGGNKDLYTIAKGKCLKFKWARYDKASGKLFRAVSSAFPHLGSN